MIFTNIYTIVKYYIICMIFSRVSVEFLDRHEGSDFHIKTLSLKIKVR